MRVSIMQPAYLPWPGYVQRALLSDLCIVMDNVKIDWHSKTQFTNRNKVLTKNGPVWLTIPLLKSKSENMIINNIVIDNNVHWQKKHFSTIEQNYGKLNHYKEHAPFFDSFFRRPFEMLVDAIDVSTNYILSAFGCATKFVKSSEIQARGAKDELVLQLCKEVGATEYVSGPFGRDYLNKEMFKEAGINLLFHDFIPISYPQICCDFIPYMSSIDMLFALGGKEAKSMLLKWSLASA